MSSVGPVAMQHLRAAAAALEVRDLVVAHEAARSALAIAPSSPDAYNLLGLIEAGRGELEFARQAFAAALSLNPRYANAWHNLAGVLAGLGREDEAIDAALKSLELARGLPYEPWYNLGLRAFTVRRFALAIDCFERALKLKPDDPRTLNNLACALDADARPVDARAVAARLIALAPASIAARHTFAAVWSKSTEPADLQQAMTHATSVLAQEPQHAGAHECVAVIYGKLPDYGKAATHARKAVEYAPESVAYRITLVRLLEQAGELEAAADVLEALPDAMRQEPELLRLRGTVALRRGHVDVAERALAAALERAPDDQAALSQHALALHRLGRDDAARTAIGLDRFLAAVALEVPSPYTDAAAFNAALANDIRNHSRLRFEPVGLAAKGGYLTEDLLVDRTPAIVGFERSLRAAIERYLAALERGPDAGGFDALFADAATPVAIDHAFVARKPRNYRLNVWATRVAAQGVIDTHIHETSWLSGAYYVELPPAVGDADRAGWIEFGRPYESLPPVDGAFVRAVKPEVGTLLLFPSYVFHRTLPFDGSGERISISFDLVALR